MNAREHIVIIGAGLIGLCTASALLRSDRRITVVDARPGPCEGTSFSNSGMLHPSQARGWSPKGPVPIEVARDVAALGARSVALLQTDFARLGLDAALVRPAGCFQLIAPETDMASALASADALGVRAQAQTQFGRPAVLFPDDRSADARAYGCALEADLHARGVAFLYEAGDVSCRRDGAGFVVTTGRDGQTLHADLLMLCTGVATPKLLAQFGLEMALIDVTGISVDFARPVMDDLPLQPVMDALSRSALTVFSDRVRISGGWNITDPAKVLERWREIAPQIMDALGPPRSTWVGHRPVSPEGQPVIGATDIPGLWVNAGHGHMGWTLCAGSAERLAQQIDAYAIISGVS